MKISTNKPALWQKLLRLTVTFSVAFVTLFGHRELVLAQNDPLVIAVMDPLCDKFACDCVQGYAQRNYEKLAKYLLKKTGKHSKVAYGESLKIALEDVDRAPDFVIGKYSVVLHGAAAAKYKLAPIAHLTGKDGSTTQSGLIVVRTADEASLVDDLEGYRIFFGPEECDEKNAAARELLKSAEVKIPEPLEISGACSEAAKKLVALEPSVKAAAVISSYAQPLLEGCGNIKKGDLRIVGETKKLHFVTVFVNEKLDPITRDLVLKALLEMGKDSEMLAALETKNGFVRFKNEIDQDVSAPAAAEGETAKKK
jgi:ABC transporter, phosphonate, periplasmic substrate-binding protein